MYLGLTTMGQNMSLPNLKRALGYAMEGRLSPPGGHGGVASSLSSAAQQAPLTAELMVHPGYPSHPQEGGCGQGPDDFSCSAERQLELSALTQPLLLDFYSQERIQLCAFKDL